MTEEIEPTDEQLKTAQALFWASPGHMIRIRAVAQLLAKREHALRAHIVKLRRDLDLSNDIVKDYASGFDWQISCNERTLEETYLCTNEGVE